MGVGGGGSMVVKVTEMSILSTKVSFITHTVEGYIYSIEYKIKNCTKFYKIIDKYCTKHVFLRCHKEGRQKNLE